MLIGAHVSIAGGVENAIGRQVDVGGNCGQIFTHSPQVWGEPSFDEADATQFRDDTEAKLKGPWVIHSAYLVNLATPKPDLREKSVANVQADLDAAAALGIPYVNVHLGAHTGAGEDAGLENAADAINTLDIPADVQLLIESDAGSGTKLGGDFGHLNRICESADPDLGICLDTAHSFVAGYDLSTRDSVDETIEEFDDVVGLDTLQYIHLNDSVHPFGSHSDQHAHLGEGEIGEDGIRAVVNHKALRDLPFVLETPTDDGKGFAENIETAKSYRE